GWSMSEHSGGESPWWDIDASRGRGQQFGDHNIQYNSYYLLTVSDQQVASRSLVAALRPPVQRLNREPRLRGRESLLERLHGPLLTATSEPRIQVLTGMGGCGKSTVALELASRALADEVDAWWIYASDADSVLGGVQALAIALGASPERIKIGGPIETVWYHLARHPRPWLLVFDNADDPQHTLSLSDESVADGRGLLRPVPPGVLGTILITSRHGKKETWDGVSS